MTDGEAVSADNVRRIARYDLRHWFRWNRVLVALLVFGGLVLLETTFVILLHIDPNRHVETRTYLRLVSEQYALIVPLFSVFVGYGAVASERESGRLRLYLAQPLGRDDFFIGRLVSRSFWTVSIVSLSVGAVWLVSIALWGLTLLPLAGFTVATCALTVTFVALAVSVSSVASTGKYTLLLLFGLIAILYFGWRFVTLFVELSGWTSATPIVAVVDPMTAYRRLLYLAIGRSVSRTVALSSTLSLLSWTVLPAFLGYHQFARKDV